MSFKDAFNGFHEEILSAYNKITSACDRGDREAAFYALLILQEELEAALNLSTGEGGYRKMGQGYVKVIP